MDELRHEARELLGCMGNVGLGDVMATPAQSQPQSSEAHREQDKERKLFS